MKTFDAKLKAEREYDMSVYFRTKILRDTTTNDSVRAVFQARMNRLLLKWPHHSDEFDDGE